MTTEPKTYSALGADLTHAEEAISQIVSRRGAIRRIFGASIDAIADIRAFADVRRGDCAICTAQGNNGDIEIRYIIPFSFGSPAAREQAENKLREALRARGYEVVNAAADGRDWTAELRAVRRDEREIRA